MIFDKTFLKLRDILYKILNIFITLKRKKYNMGKNK